MKAPLSDRVDVSIDSKIIDIRKSKEAAWRLQSYLNQKWYENIAGRYLMPVLACFAVLGTGFAIFSELFLSLLIDDSEIRRLILCVALFAVVSFYAGFLVGDRHKTKYIAFIDLVSSLITVRGLESSLVFQGQSLDVEVCGTKHALCPIDLLLIKYATELDDPITNR